MDSIKVVHSKKPKVTDGLQLGKETPIRDFSELKGITAIPSMGAAAEDLDIPTKEKRYSSGNSLSDLI
jgi:hypothetical protein